MKRKKPTTTPPSAKDKQTPANDQKHECNVVPKNYESKEIVDIMKRDGVSYNEALKISIYLDTEEKIYNVSKITESLQLDYVNGSDFPDHFSKMVSGRSG